MNQLALDFSTRPLIPPPEGCTADIARLFELTTLQIIEAGFSRYSADAVLHRMRWHQHIERGNREFVCNNNWTAPLARWFMAKHPKHDGFFETRESPRKKTDA